MKFNVQVWDGKQWEMVHQTNDEGDMMEERKIWLAIVKKSEVRVLDREGAEIIFPKK